MSTPDSSIVKSRYSPFCSGINKNLLTPCRRVGLSRKRKTPHSNFEKLLSDDLNTSTSSIISINSYSENETTPVSHNKSLNRRKKSENLLRVSSSDNIFQNKLKTETENLQENCDIKSKKALQQASISEDLFDSNDELPCSMEKNRIEDNENTPVYVRRDTDQISNEEFVASFKSVSDEANVSNAFNLVTGKLNLKKDGRINSENIHLRNENAVSQTVTISDDSEDDFVINRDKKQKTTKKSVKILSLRKSSCCKTDNPFEIGNLKESSCIKKCKIKLQKLSENDILATANSPFVEESIFSKSVSKRCNLAAADDTDFFTSTPEEEKVKRKNLEKKVKVFESQVKQKQLILENLQRACIYKNKHNIHDLKQLTSVWLNGCVQALKDLLPLLQAHGPMDLNTLLNNMGIPKEIVAKLSLRVD